MDERAITRNTAREQLILTAVEHLSRRGPGGIQPQEVCRELGMSKALVNYHFGNREGLIAEAMIAGFDDHVADLTAAVGDAGTDPVDRLMAWIHRHIEWTATRRGLAAALDFPDAAIQPTDARLDDDLRQRLEVIRRRNVSNLMQLVSDARDHLRRDQPATALDAPDEAALTGAAVGWLTSGVALWAGRQNPGRHDGPAALAPFTPEQLRGIVIGLLSR